MMKKRHIVLIVLLLIVAIPLILVITDQNKIYRGTDALIEKARKEIPIADAENTEINFAGLCGKDDKALLWFVSGNEYQAHYYLPMECSVVEKDEYKFERIYNPWERGMDIAVLEWMRGYSFVINNPNCVSVKIDGESGPVYETIGKDCYPYVFYYNGLPREYVFLDKDGNEVY